MSKREDAIVQAFIDHANLPAKSFTVLPTRTGTTFRLHVWIDDSFMHAIKEMPKEVRGVPIVFEAKPTMLAYTTANSQ